MGVEGAAPPPAAPPPHNHHHHLQRPATSPPHVKREHDDEDESSERGGVAAAARQPWRITNLVRKLLQSLLRLTDLTEDQENIVEFTCKNFCRIRIIVR